MKEMAARLGISRPDISRMIEGMAEHGLVRVVEDLLGSIEGIEKALEEKSLFSRVSERLSAEEFQGE